MGFFGGRSSDDLKARVTELARTAFAERGVETIVALGADAHDMQLHAIDGQRYPLYNLFAQCREEPPRRWKAIVARHVERMLSIASEPRPEALSASQLAEQVRTRILPRHPVDGMDFSYARPFAPGMMVALCIDFPQTVSTLTTETVDALALSVGELYELGQRNTDAERIDEFADAGDGIRVIGGESLFIAAKAANLGALVASGALGDCPLGLVFCIPNRNTIFYTVPRDASVISSINTLLRLLDSMREENGYTPAGGVLSSDLYYWRNDEVQRIGWRDPDTGQLGIYAEGAFGEMVAHLE